MTGGPTQARRLSACSKRDRLDDVRSRPAGPSPVYTHNYPTDFCRPEPIIALVERGLDQGMAGRLTELCRGAVITRSSARPGPFSLLAICRGAGAGPEGRRGRGHVAWRRVARGFDRLGFRSAFSNSVVRVAGPPEVALHHERRVRAVAGLDRPGAPRGHRLPGVRREGRGGECWQLVHF